MKKENFLKIEYSLFSTGLKPLEILVYSYIDGWAKNNSKVFISNARIAKDLGMGIGMVKEYIKRLEAKGLLKRWSHNGTRYMKSLPIDGMNTDCSQNTDHTIDNKLTTTSQNTDRTIVSKLSRYNNNYKNINKNSYKPDLGIFMEKYILGMKYQTEDGYKELLNELTKEEYQQVEIYLEKNRKEPYKATINELLQNKLYINQNQI
jgi:DNA-binding MarR family transcriptional regulator